MKKLIEALHVIQDECKKHKDCVSCPMSMNDGNICCATDIEPSGWKINDEIQKALL